MTKTRQRFVSWAAAVLATSTLTCASAPHGQPPEASPAPSPGDASGPGDDSLALVLRALSPPPGSPAPSFRGRADRAPEDPGAWLVREQVALRMQDEDDAMRERVAAAILGAARRSGLDPVLLLAIIEVESGFDPAARSGRDALGLMQVRPATLWREAERSGLAGDDPHDPHLNVFAGALYFRRLVRAFGPNDVALMAYNAGPNRVIGHIKAGSIPVHLREYPRRVRAAEARLRRSLAAACASVSPGAPAPPSVRCPWSS